MYKKVNVVMLPTEKASNLYLDGYKKLNLFPIVDELNSNKQHLYILSDEEIKEGDWVINNLDKGIGKALRYLNKGEIKDKEYSKIIATIDKSLKGKWLNTCFSGEEIYERLAQIPKSFIEYFVSEYNKGNIIKSVLVEYEYKCGCKGLVHDGCDYEEPRLKINPDNTINIKPIKDSKYKDLYKAIDKIKEGYKGSAINFIERFINTQKN